jgi:hypothetical protein
MTITHYYARPFPYCFVQEAHIYLFSHIHLTHPVCSYLLANVVENHLPKPGTMCFATSIQGTSVGFMYSVLVGNVGIGGLIGVNIVLVVLVPLVIVPDGCGWFFPLSIKAYVPFEGVSVCVAESTSLVKEG